MILVGQMILVELRIQTQMILAGQTQIAENFGYKMVNLSCKIVNLHLEKIEHIEKVKIHIETVN